MKSSTILLLILFFFTGNILSQEQTSDFPTLTGPYLGQEPPGKQAEQFNPGIFPAGESQGCSGFLNEGKVFVFKSAKDGTNWYFSPTYITELKDGKWTEPEIAPFSGYMPYNFTVGPGGQTIYFTSMKSPDKTTYKLLEQANIWAVKLQKNGWTEPVMFGNSINTDRYYENYPSVTSDGTVYYMSRRVEGVGRTDVWKSRNNDGKYFEAENNGRPVNTEGSDVDPFIAPDESYIIVCQKKPEGFGQYDLYISFRQSDGSWMEPVNMGPDVNSAGNEFRPYVTPDSKYIFFTHYSDDFLTGNVFWADAGIIEDLKPNNLK